MEKINVNNHSSIQIGNLFFDPFKIDSKTEPAKIVFLTHTHYDHLSIEDLKKVIDKNSVFVATADAEQTLSKHFAENKKVFVLPNQDLNLDGIKIETFSAYNINKNFHKKEFNWVGYKITLNGTTYVVVGDSDVTPELENLRCDVLFVPIGGTYTMTASEAANLTNKIKPSLVIPVHYNSLVGNKNDEKTFLNLLSKDIKYKIFL